MNDASDVSVEGKADTQSRERELLDYYACEAMKSLVSSNTIMSVDTHGGGGASSQPPMHVTQIAKTAFAIAEEMVFQRRDSQKKIKLR